MVTFSKLIGIPSGGGRLSAIATSDNVTFTADALGLVFGTDTGAFTVKKGSDNFLAVTNAGAVQIGNASTNPSVSFLGTGAVSVGGALTVTGNLTVNGTTTTVNSTVVDIADRVIHVNHSTGADVAVPSQVTGLAIHRGAVGGVDRDHSALVWDESASLWKFAVNTGGDDATLGAFQSVKMLNLELGSAAATITGGADSVQVQNIADLTSADTVTGGWTFGTAATTFTSNIHLNGGSITTQTGGAGDLGASGTRLGDAWLTGLNATSATIGTLSVTNLAMSGTQNLTFTVNSDAAAGTAESPSIVLKGGNGVDAIHRATLTQIDEAGGFALDTYAGAAGATPVSPTFHLGGLGMDGTANITSKLNFNGTDALGVMGSASFTFDAEENTLTLGDEISQLTLDGVVTSVVASANTFNFIHGGTTAFLISSTSGYVGVESVQFSGAAIGVSGATDLVSLSSVTGITFGGVLNSAYDAHFTATGGSSGSPDFDVAGYALLGGTVDINGSIDADVSSASVVSAGVVNLEAAGLLNLHSDVGVTTNYTANAAGALSQYDCVAFNASGEVAAARANAQDVLVQGVMAASATLGSSTKNKVVEFGRVNLLMETGITAAANDMLYLSAAEAGKVTNVIPTAGGTTVYLVGKALAADTEGVVPAALHRQFLYNN